MIMNNQREDEDMISQLHQPLLHHILCYLSQKEAVQTCVLSKSWRHLGPTRPKVEFGKEFFNGNEEGKYLSILEKTLQRYHEQKFPILEFIVVGMKESSKSYSLLQEWVPMALPGAHKFHLSIDWAKSLFRLPPELLKAEFLTELVLQNCQIDDSNVLCKHLRTLRLDFVYITDATLEKITSSCPLIEYLDMHSCEGLQTIKLTKAPYLKAFAFFTSNCPSWIHNPSMYFPRLKKLFLLRLQLSDESIDKFSTHFPSLEDLNISYFSDSERFRLSSRSIKHLTIAVEGSSLEDAIIDAPNICSFAFSCYSLPPSLSFTTTSTEWKSRICVKDFDNRLIEICKALSTSQISLHFDYIPKVVPGNFGDVYQPLVIENLILKGKSCSSVPNFLNGLFRNYHPRNIEQEILVAGHHSDERELQHMELLCKVLLLESERAQFFGQQYLEDVKMEVFKQNDKEWRGVEGTSCLSEFALPLNSLKIRFRLKWRIE